MWKLLYWARSNLPTARLQARWLNEHGPLVARHASTLGIIKYTQNHRIEGELDSLERSGRPMVRADERPLDIIDEICFESREALAAALDTAGGSAAMAELVQSESCLLDLRESQLHTVLEFPLINPTPETIFASPCNTIVKTIAMVLPKSGDQLLNDVSLWMSYHVPLVRRLAPLLGILRYMGNHPLSLAHPMPDEDPMAVRLRRMRPLMGEAAPDYQGVSCEWQTLEAARGWTIDEEKIAARRQILDDEDTFERGMFLMAKEHVLVDRYRH